MGGIRLPRWAERTMSRRVPDLVIGEAERPYLRRWWIIPRNRFFNLYLHDVLRSDDDRALHDHPWWNVSVVLAGRYIEHTIAAGGIEHRAERAAGSFVFRRARQAHRLEVLPGERAVTLFITGPRLREWGFHCTKAGWVHWQDFTAGDNGELVGRGCGEDA
ncbi:hypothetical protein [Sphingomonas sanxanigenens]|uniref:Cupin 2 conserved barrel domain-containing protein n=1 Tax=Sphingomonas sanxanigenens DSM 19645 = NX02 TaxID=1123269 RepID=W0A3S7_9SPHN|nr:hypothetical protein [Sphingomonas sanxanigenens]AHE52599.1 hypothetical protein NX02_04255 [Sphingomonas sanxanigenens DSM 19645 = NX02]AHE56044.1 hypothetical protein NX02_22090 [Sphingomonas sanxanigenens DSM 19645 = NX02]